MKKNVFKKIYRFSCLLFVAALALAVPAPGDGDVHADALPINDAVIRVHLSSYGAPASISMEAIGSHKIADNGKALSGKFTAAVSGGKIKITAGSAVYTLDADVTIQAGSTTVNDLIKIGGNYSYAGDFRLIVKSGGIKIVNGVDYETYTTGVLPYEMSNSWPVEALKAQAVAARSYAYAAANSRNRETQEHDVVNTTASQVYYGYNAANKNCIEAVNATANQILVDKNGAPVYTFFSASNGGYTEYPQAARVSTSNPAYLPYREDPYDLAYALASTSYSAKLTIPKSFTAATLKTSSAQPYAMFRSRLSAAGFDVDALTGTVAVKSIELNTPRYTSPSPDRVFTGADITLTMTDPAQAGDVKLSFACYTDANGVKRPFLNDVLNLSNKSKFSALYLRDDLDSFLLASVRYGHGAGMSQVGAYQMAKSNLTYRDILTFYYLEGTESKLVTNAWDIDNGVTTFGTWKKSDGFWYYYGADGVMKTGWQKIKERWYYLNSDGAMKTGWQKIKNKWYYLGGAEDGAMKTGWKKINNKWYYLGGAEDGAMKAGWQKIKNIWYYLGGAEDGAMRTGWQTIGGKKYYLGGADDGAMRTGAQTIGGKKYLFASSGALQ